MSSRASESFSVSEALHVGWATFRGNFGAFLVLGLFALVLGLFADAIPKTVTSTSLNLALSISIRILQAALTMTHLRLAIRTHDGREPANASSHAWLADFATYLLAAFVNTTILIVGLCLFIVPAVIWGVRYAFAPTLVVAGETDPIAAFRESARLTRGRQWMLFRFFALLVLLNILGALALGVGLFISVPTTTIAFVHMMRRLQTAGPLPDAQTNVHDGGHPAAHATT